MSLDCKKAPKNIFHDVYVGTCPTCSAEFANTRQELYDVRGEIVNSKARALNIDIVSRWQFKPSIDEFRIECSFCRTIVKFKNTKRNNTRLKSRFYFPRIFDSITEYSIGVI